MGVSDEVGGLVFLEAVADVVPVMEVTRGLCLSQFHFKFRGGRGRPDECVCRYFGVVK